MEENKVDPKVETQSKEETGQKVSTSGQVIMVVLFIALLAALGYGLLTLIQIISEAWAVTLSGMTNGLDGNFYPRH